MLADIAVLNSDYFSVKDDAIKNIQSVLTMVGGKIVYATDEFSSYSPPPIPVLPDWSPVNSYGGYYSFSPIDKRDSKNLFMTDIIKYVLHSDIGTGDVRPGK